MRKKKSFTIIEILITMIIMGTLSATLVPRIGDAKEKANDTLTKINTNRSAACGVDGLEDFCDSSAQGGADNSDGVHYNGNDITVCRKEECITMMDRNLGATSNDITSPNSYGYFFQRGNNYGFSSKGDITIDSEQIDCSKYSPNNPLNRDIFIAGNNPTNWSFSYCTEQNINLWGGKQDNDPFGNVNSRYPFNNEKERKGPCPNGYHVPGYEDWSRLMCLWSKKDWNNFGGCDLSPFADWDPDVLLKFQNDFKLPFAGVRNGSKTRTANGGDILYQGENNAMVWTSSPTDGYARVFRIYYDGEHSYMGINNGYKISDGVPVRCFKNSN